MKCLPMMLRSVSGLSCQFRAPWMIRTFSMKSNSGGDGNERKSSGFFESADDFEQRIFSGVSENIPNTDSFYQKLDRLEKARGRFGTGSRGNDGNNYQFMDGLDESFNSLSDGMDGKLKKAATYFAHSDEMNNDDYAFRPDISFRSGMSYTTKDLDLTKPGIRKSFKRSEFDVTTEEVLRKADFRNVRFLANFITEAGIIIKRSKTRISAKAQRKVAREIKTARAFGLMPFTTMGTKAFVFGNTMEDFIMDYKFDGYNASPMAVEAEEKEPI
ncbi:uncharacterized protein LOC131255651 isoform X2 [Magnolia sinica]|uniref:uncharacterized protein LOC131255651 isoform X2 n=1 Tax=Magnolia sinica TaxID=86752 RepID=UPI0026595922|nr:uncharacterized protein LOC131255651 isoform X2 [Magnolia sinica]